MDGGKLWIAKWKISCHTTSMDSFHARQGCALSVSDGNCTGNSRTGIFDNNKALLVARGDRQRPGINYNELFVPMMRLESLRTLLALAASRDLIQSSLTLRRHTRMGTLRKGCTLSNSTVMLRRGRRLGCGVSRRACLDWFRRVALGSWS